MTKLEKAEKIVDQNEYCEGVACDNDSTNECPAQR
jgi:hypothetical protein